MYLCRCTFRQVAIQVRIHFHSHGIYVVVPSACVCTVFKLRTGPEALSYPKTICSESRTTRHVPCHLFLSPCLCSPTLTKGLPITRACLVHRSSSRAHGTQSAIRTQHPSLSLSCINHCLLFDNISAYEGTNKGLKRLQEQYHVAQLRVPNRRHSTGQQQKRVMGQPTVFCQANAKVSSGAYTGWHVLLS